MLHLFVVLYKIVWENYAGGDIQVFKSVSYQYYGMEKYSYGIVEVCRCKQC